MSVDLFVARIDETKPLRPLMGVRLCLLVASLAFVSCVVPVDVPEPDPGDSGSDASVDAGIPLDAGQGTDAGLDAGIDAGVTPLPCSVPDDLGFFVAGATRQFIFSGCATSTFSSEPGVSVVSRPNLDGSATVTITPSTLGAWGLTISTNSSTLRRDLITDEARAPPRTAGGRAAQPGSASALDELRSRVTGPIPSLPSRSARPLEEIERLA